ncbi:hypothetical protein PUR49_08180 [Streptomyces sp. BE147]|uniref:hypothetical protein n=1 Tax=Streptomyces sp. BE147 TaxID=3002524 RepID=UPI002E75DB2A|nr:hypothetical protein [Streptomyces sp. BE147]MEE1736476.1 hypothetical protein [Streptomyces sp. BE147]
MIFAPSRYDGSDGYAFTHAGRSLLTHLKTAQQCAPRPGPVWVVRYTADHGSTPAGSFLVLTIDGMTSRESAAAKAVREIDAEDAYARTAAADPVHRLTTGPLITGALEAEGLKFEADPARLTVPTRGGRIEITANSVNDPDHEQSGYDIYRGCLMGFAATWHSTITPHAPVSVVYDGTAHSFRPGRDAAECAADVAAWLTPDGGRRRKLLRAARDTSRPAAAKRAAAELRGPDDGHVRVAADHRAASTVPIREANPF